jgi:geranylgeranyl transferase type-2 subunit alpha
LTSKVLKINPEFYTIWNYRRQILLQIEFIPFVETLQTAQTKLDQPKPIPSDTNKGVEEEEVYGAYETRVASLLKDELQFLVPLLTTFPKCYWIWNHRLWTLHQASVLMSADKAILFWTQELALVGMMLTRDMRNFHGWMYRRLIVANLEEISQGNMVQQEFDYTSKMVRGVGGMTNYSAWHQRSVLFPRLILENGCDEQERMDLLEDGESLSITPLH